MRLLQTRVLLITGGPGVGKTSVLLKTIDMLKAKGFTVGGILSREVRSSGTRVGFEVMDLYDGKKGWLAHTSQKYGPQIGKYGVNFADLEGIGTEAVKKANKICDIVAVDEIGPMELFSERFRNVVEYAVDGLKPVVATIHWRKEDEFVKKIKTRQDAEIFVVTRENRDSLPPVIARKAVEYLAAAGLE